MSDRASSAALPRNVHTRERLREAQAAEARALAAVCAAELALARVVTKQNRVIDSARAAVSRAEHAVDVTRVTLVEVSGLDRAATLLGLNRKALRRTAAAVARNDEQ